ncbi:MFS general substrate transporter [Gonapodya prolifera JEL478]|uniref:MFS general substrate transporter n=1 Tax=Gonapodya prolifera (strain JEL478) TaxID=1344416 RepID=A0A139A5J6_GONPJ|nr:MFS general substrate transporter [Gonapodya prolifera JEL478]|eukprot:KXS12087.1 MFS general substrate transporter [Gonapodya prolifera JEL478]
MSARESTISLKNAKVALKKLVTEPIRKPESPIALLSKLSPKQWVVFTAAFLGWALDAMDYFLLTLAVSDISKEFGTSDSAVTSAITLTLLLRPVGALIFGLAGDKWGRRYPLMINVIMYSILELATGFCPNFASFLVVRSLFGIAMGGEWGLGASLAMEAIPAECRGLFSGILQQGYATGNLISSGLFSLVYMYYPSNWRALFYIGCFPAVLIIVIRFLVPESEAYQNQEKRRAATHSNFLADLGITMKLYWPRAIYCILLMTFFNFFSHGSQDLFPTYITKQLGYSSSDKAATVAISSTGAIIGGTLIGFLGQYFGRRRAIIFSAFCAGVLIYPWAFSSSKAGIQGAGFAMQFFVQGAWGCVPSYLTEISPPSIRATFPGLMYNTGNMISAASAQIEAAIADNYPTRDYKGGSVPNYALTQAIFIAFTVVALIVTISIGVEDRDANLVTGDVQVADISEDGTDTKENLMLEEGNGAVEENK